MSKTPLVSISIPTYNSEVFIAKCLDAIYGQTYKNIEVNIVDGLSKDDTKIFAKKYKLDFLEDTLGLLNARKIGAEKSRGDFILLLDSDQILEPDAIERAVRECEEKKLDMLVLEEDVYSNKTILEKLFHLDRKLIHAVKDFSPYTGVMLPRFYRALLLKEAFGNIPAEALKAGGQDHAIIYYEAWQISQKIDLLRLAVRHIEPSSFQEIIPKFYRWGYTSLSARNIKYVGMLEKKESFRKGMFRKGLWTASIGSILLLAVKGVPYQIGRTMAMLHSRSARKTIS